MKKSQKVTRIRLEVENNDYILFGLVSADPDYKLCLALNKKLRINLKNINAVRISPADDPEESFSRFSTGNEHEDHQYHLISNRSGKNYLLEKLKNIDYLLQIYTYGEHIDINSLTAILKETDSISAVFNIKTDKLKDKNLVYLTL